MSKNRILKSDQTHIKRKFKTGINDDEPILLSPGVVHEPDTGEGITAPCPTNHKTPRSEDKSSHHPSPSYQRENAPKQETKKRNNAPMYLDPGVVHEPDSGEGLRASPPLVQSKIFPRTHCGSLLPQPSGKTQEKYETKKGNARPQPRLLDPGIIHEPDSGEGFRANSYSGKAFPHSTSVSNSLSKHLEKNLFPYKAQKGHGNHESMFQDPGVIHEPDSGEGFQVNGTFGFPSKPNH